VRFLLAGLIVTFAACGARSQQPYHFRSPLLGSVTAPELPLLSREHVTGDRQPATGDRRQATGDGRQPERLAIQRPALEAPAPRVKRSIPSAALEGRGVELAERLRGLVGRRDESSTHVGLALAALREIGAALDPETARVEDGPALVALAERRGALTAAPPGSPLPALRLGDLLVFDRVTAADPASLVAVVVSVDERGVVEFVYLARGVVRRGFVFPPEPASKRDATGRVLNTFVRHNDGGDPRGSPHLAGELIAAVISLDRLLR